MDAVQAPNLRSPGPPAERRVQVFGWWTSEVVGLRLFESVRSTASQTSGFVEWVGPDWRHRCHGARGLNTFRLRLFGWQVPVVNGGFGRCRAEAAILEHGCSSRPRHSMYGIFIYIGVVLGVNVGIYGIHGVFGIVHSESYDQRLRRTS